MMLASRLTIVPRLSLRLNYITTKLHRNYSFIKTIHTVKKNSFALPKGRLLFACGTISSFGLCVCFLNKSKSPLFCHENNDQISQENLNTEKKCNNNNDDETSSKLTSSTWLILWHFLKDDFTWLLLSIPSAILAAYFNIKINLALGDLMNVIQNCLQNSTLSLDENFLSNFYNLVKVPTINLLKTYLLQSTFTLVYLYSLFVLAEQTANRIRYELFSKLLSFELSFFDMNNGGNILSTLSNDVQEFKSSFKQIISLGIRNFAQIVGCLFTLYYISPEMTIVINVVIIPSMALIGSQVGSRLRKLSKKLQNQLGKITDVAFESINNIRTVKMLALEDLLISKFFTEIRNFDVINQKFSFGFALFQSMTNFAFNCIVLVTLIFGGHNLLNGRLSAGNLMSFLATTQTIQRSLFQLSLLYGHYIKLTSSLQRIVDYLLIDSPQTEGQILSDVTGNIEFKDVIFRYPKRTEHTVLNKINLNFESGKVTAICGSSGSGKSTIAMLLENLYDLESGTVSLDNVKIDNLDKKWLRKDVIGYISQEPILFCTSVKENIKYGKPDATDEEVIRAAQLANAHQFIHTFPNQYETVVGQQGTALSGGQRQRIAIARAIIKNPKILILDEATSALDSESEALVKNALDNVMQGRTVLVIAHRLSTIVNSDKIIVLDQGNILEYGTHAQLLRKKGKYYDLVMKSVKSGIDKLDD